MKNRYKKILLNNLIWINTIPITVPIATHMILYIFPAAQNQIEKLLKISGLLIILIAFEVKNLILK